MFLIVFIKPLVTSTFQPKSGRNRMLSSQSPSQESQSSQCPVIPETQECDSSSQNHKATIMANRPDEIIKDTLDPSVPSDEPVQESPKPQKELVIEIENRNDVQVTMIIVWF